MMMIVAKIMLGSQKHQDKKQQVNRFSYEQCFDGILF